MSTRYVAGSDWHRPISTAAVTYSGEHNAAAPNYVPRVQGLPWDDLRVDETEKPACVRCSVESQWRLSVRGWCAGCEIDADVCEWGRR